MKHSILLLLMVLPLLVLTGCMPVPSDGSGETQGKTETSSVDETQPDWVGLYYSWRSGSMAGMNYSYSVTKDPTGDCLFYAEIEAEGRVVDREISQEEFDAILQMAKDNYVPETDAGSEDDGGEYELLDADSAGFEAIFADGETQPVHFGQADKEILSLLEKLLDESST